MATNIRNLIAIDDNERIIWNSEFGQLEVGEGDSKQILLLTSRPYFNVKDIKLSPTKNYLSLSGDNGITILEMPRRWGTSYKSDRDNLIYCKTININERLFTCEKRLRIMHTVWHPHKSEAKQLLCILTNDNRLRFHNVIEDEEVQVVNLHIPNEYDEDGDQDDICNGLSMLNLGENAVCFDFGPPLVVQPPEILWPIYILMGSGDILLVYSSPYNPTYAEHIIGPLTMLPQAEDNYGSDACSLLVLDSSPPLLAIATPNGSIYHCFAFMDKFGVLAKQTLCVYEQVELSKDLIENPDDPYSPHPMKLYKDPTSEIRYFCAHQNGVHTVVLPILETLQSECDIFQDKESFSEFIICTRATTPSNPDESCDLSTPRGLAVEIKQAHIVLLVLMPQHELIAHRISPATTLINRKRFPRHSLETSRDSSDQMIVNVSQLEASRGNFEEQIQLILKRKTNVPMLKLSDDSEQKDQIPELMEKALNTFRSEYIKKYNLALEAIKKKLAILEKDMQNQKTEYNKIGKEKEEIYNMVVALSSKADLTVQKQKNLLSRIDKVLSAVAYGSPDMTEAETALRRELNGLNDKICSYKNELDSVINKHKYHMNQKDARFNNSGGDLMLSQTQLSGIKDTLSKHGADISELKKVIKSRQK